MPKLSEYQQTLRAVVNACGAANPDTQLLSPGTLYNFAHKHLGGCLASTPSFRSLHALGDKGVAWDLLRGARQSLVCAVNPHYTPPAPIAAVFSPGDRVWDAGDRTVYRVVSTNTRGVCSLTWHTHSPHEIHRTRPQDQLRLLADQRAGLGCYLRNQAAPETK